MFCIFVKTDITNTNSVLIPCCINEFFIIFPDDGRAESCARVIAAAPPGTRAPRAPRRLLSSISPDAEPEHPLTVLVLAKEGSKKPGPARSVRTRTAPSRSWCPPSTASCEQDRNSRGYRKAGAQQAWANARADAFLLNTGPGTWGLKWGLHAYIYIGGDQEVVGNCYLASRKD